MEYKYQIFGLDCANCASELELKIKQIKDVSDARIQFLQQKMSFWCDEKIHPAVEKQVMALIETDEPECRIIAEPAMRKQFSYKINGLDCANCAAELERKIALVPEVSEVKLDFMKRTLTYCGSLDHTKQYEERIRKIISEDEPDCTLTAEDDIRTYRFHIKNIDCADCADALAEKAALIEGVVDAEADFMHAILRVRFHKDEYVRIEEQLRELISYEEPEVEFRRYEEDILSADQESAGNNIMLIRLVAGALLFGISLFLHGIAADGLSLLAYIVLGYDIIYKAFVNLKRGHLLDEHFLMMAATFAALYLKDWKEAAAVMLFYQIGEYFQDLAVDHSRKSISSLLNIRPEHAFVQCGDTFIKMHPDEVKIGDIIQIRPGERIPLDGVIVKGSSSLDAASLTGESKLKDVDVEDEVLSGVVNISGVLEVQVTKLFHESAVSKILRLLEEDTDSKSKQEKFITKFSRYYTPLVVFSAIIVAVVVGIVTKDINEGIYRACTFLVISCPCALVISIPLSFFAGIGGLSKKGIMLKGANDIEKIAAIKTIIFDKTGTLTTGEFAVDRLLDSEDDAQVIMYAAYAESFSGHPIAKAIRNAYAKPIDQSVVSNMQEIPGKGISIELDGHDVIVGNYKMMRENQISCRQYTEPGTFVYVAQDHAFIGCILLKDKVKEHAKEALAKLNKNDTCMMVSGDANDICVEVAAELGISKVYGECLPEDKISCVNAVKENGVSAFVGDGMNDVPVMRSADIAFVMGALGSDAAIEAADVVITDDRLDKIDLTIRHAKRVIRVANQNIVFAIAVKLLALLLGALGITNMWMAIFADTGVALLCVINAIRLLRVQS